MAHRDIPPWNQVRDNPGSTGCPKIFQFREIIRTLPHLIAIRDTALLQRLAPLCTTGRFIEQACFAVAIVTDPANRWHEIDGARAVQNMELAGWNEGVGTCWIGGLERDQIKELLAIPPHLHLLTMLPFGYPTEPDAPRRRTKKRPEEIVHWDRFGQGR